MTILDSSKLKEFANNNFKSDEKSWKVLQRVESLTRGKGEISLLEQFLHFQCFLKDLYCRHVKSRACLEKGYVLTFSCSLTIEFHRRIFLIFSPSTTQSRLLSLFWKRPSKNIAGKGENAGNQQFLLFPQCVLLYQT